MRPPATTGAMNTGWPRSCVVSTRPVVASTPTVALAGGQPQAVAGQHRAGPGRRAGQLDGPLDLAVAAA